MAARKSTHKPGPITGSLTRSLHTPTAVARLAHMLVEYRSRASREALVREALSVLGQDGKNVSASDPTFVACLNTLDKLIEREARE